MKRFILLIIGTLFLSSCSSYPQDSDGMMQGHGMMGHGNQQNASAFLPGMDVNLRDLPEAKPSQTIDVKDGDTISLEPMIVRKSIAGKEFAMYGYNGQVPGPMIRATQGAEIKVNVKNSIDLPTTIHWHGIRLENGNDGVPDVTQEAIEPDGTYRYTVVFPDEGIYWYHPHVREDIQQDMGLYGNLLIEPDHSDAYAPVNASEVVILDDLLLADNGDPMPYGAETANFSLMGRFGNVFLINGDTSYERTVKRGSVVRFYFTNVANARPFRITIPGAHMKLVGSDVGRYEQESFIDSLTLGPAERGIVDVYFEKAGTYSLQHTSPVRTEDLGTIVVTNEPASPDLKTAFNELRTNADVRADIDAFRPYFDKPVDKTLRLTISMGMMGRGMGMQHGEMMGGIASDGIEWEEDSVMNADMPAGMMKWQMIDEETDRENMDINWQFKRGDVVKVRIVNDQDSMHPMQHPMHFHGQRFLVLSMDGTPNQNLVWKDTVQIPAGSTADLLFDMSNPGEWMFHCHIAEHLTDGMMGMMVVE